MGSVIGFLNIYLLDEQLLNNPDLVVSLSYPSPTLSFLQEIICLVFFFQSWLMYTSTLYESLCKCNLYRFLSFDDAPFKLSVEPFKF